MIRKCALAALVLGACWLTAVAQNPPPTDPDAKGSITISVDVKNGVTTVTVTRDASDGWDVGTVFVYGIDPIGGFIYSQAVAFKQADGDPPPKTSSTTLPLPNGSFIVWATHVVTEKSGSGTQVVGSALSTATVTNSPSPAVTPGGSITCSPTRVSGGAGFKASGKWDIFNGWTRDPNNTWIYFDTVPTGGGVVRRLAVTAELD